MRHSIVENARVNDDIFSLEMEGKAIQAPGSGTIQVFSIQIVVRPVTGTLEAIAVIAERNGTAQVNTTLIERDPERAIARFENRF